MPSDSRGKVHLTYNSNTAMKDKNIFEFVSGNFTYSQMRIDIAG